MIVIYAFLLANMIQYTNGMNCLNLCKLFRNMDISHDEMIGNLSYNQSNTISNNNTEIILWTKCEGICNETSIASTNETYFSVHINDYL